MRALILCVVGLAGCGDPKAGPSTENPERFRVVRESLYNQVVVERDGAIVDLKFRRGRNVPRQTAVDLENPEHLVLPYTRAMLSAALIQPEPRRILQLGLGGGAMNRYLRRVFPATRITTAEIDATVRDMAVEFMDWRPDANDVAVIEDARTFARRSGERWDWILVDAYSGGSVPPHLKTREFYEILRSRLAPGGVVALNIHQGNRLYASDQATLRAVFDQVWMLPVRGVGNVIALAWMGTPGDVPNTPHDGLSESLAAYLKEALTESPRPAEPGALVLTDDHAPAEFLLGQPSGRTER